jgi:uncharacterized protein YjbI with pentapeptide repeats
MKAEKLKKVLELHAAWLLDSNKGKRADLAEANMRWANLAGADLAEANLRGAKNYQAALAIN